MFGKIILNSRTSHNNIANMQNNKISRNIDALSMSDPTIFDKNFKDRGGERTRRFSKFDIFYCSICIILKQFGYCIQINIEWNLKSSTNGWNAGKNIYAVNWCTIPIVSSGNTSRDKHISSTAFLRSCSYTFILKAMKILNRDSLMVPFSKKIVVEI